MQQTKRNCPRTILRACGSEYPLTAEVCRLLSNLASCHLIEGGYFTEYPKQMKPQTQQLSVHRGVSMHARTEDSEKKDATFNTSTNEGSFSHTRLTDQVPNTHFCPNISTNCKNKERLRSQGHLGR